MTYHDIWHPFNYKQHCLFTNDKDRVIFRSSVTVNFVSEGIRSGDSDHWLFDLKFALLVIHCIWKTSPHLNLLWLVAGVSWPLGLRSERRPIRIPRGTFSGRRGIFQKLIWKTLLSLASKHVSNECSAVSQYITLYCVGYLYEVRTM